MAKLALKSLSTDHWFHHVPVTDIKKMGDTGFYDALLHKRDVSYTLPRLFDWIQKAGYHFVHHTVPEQSLPLLLINRITDTMLFDKLLKNKLFQQQAIAELILGHITIQEFYVSNF